MLPPAQARGLSQIRALANVICTEVLGALLPQFVGGPQAHCRKEGRPLGTGGGVSSTRAIAVRGVLTRYDSRPPTLGRASRQLIGRVSEGFSRRTRLLIGLNVDTPAYSGQERSPTVESADLGNCRQRIFWP